MEVGPGNLKKRDIEKFDTTNCLSPLEHAVTGGSVAIPIQGKDKLLSDKSTENTIRIDDLFAIDPKLATAPIGITNGRKTSEKIRNVRKGRRVDVILVVFGQKGVMETMGKGINVDLELGEMTDDETVNELIFSFYKNKEKINAGSLGMGDWELDERFKNIFSVPVISENGKLVLSVIN